MSRLLPEQRTEPVNRSPTQPATPSSAALSNRPSRPVTPRWFTGANTQADCFKGLGRGYRLWRSQSPCVGAMSDSVADAATLVCVSPQTEPPSGDVDSVLERRIGSKSLLCWTGQPGGHRGKAVSHHATPESRTPSAPLRSAAHHPGVMARREPHRSIKALSEGLHFPAVSLPLRRMAALAGMDPTRPGRGTHFCEFRTPGCNVSTTPNTIIVGGASLTALSCRDPKWNSTGQRRTSETMSGRMSETLKDGAELLRISGTPRSNYRASWKAAIQSGKSSDGPAHDRGYGCSCEIMAQSYPAHPQASRIGSLPGVVESRVASDITDRPGRRSRTMPDVRMSAGGQLERHRFLASATTADTVPLRMRLDRHSCCPDRKAA